MKKFSICFVIFAFLSIVCIFAGIYAIDTEKKVPIQEKKSVENAIQEENREVTANQNNTKSHMKKESQKEQYYLVSEDGFLLVFCRDQTTVCLYTHMPIMDFPEREQERLREGIWFDSMMDIFNYLESYSS